MSNFACLQSEWFVLYEAATKAEGMANTDARTSCFYARRTLVLIPLLKHIAVVPAGIAGTQWTRMVCSEHIPMDWIPAVHAGMTTK